MSEVKQEGDFKMKSKKTSPKKLGNESNEPIKVNIDEVKEPAAEEVAKVVIPEVKEDTIEEPVVVVEDAPEVDQENGIIEIVDEDNDTPPNNQLQEAAEEYKQVAEQRVLPENIDKLVTFMEETGGSVEDYVRLNADYSLSLIHI